MLKKQAGFTLIELVMVIVLLGILAAIAVPKYADMQTQAREAVLDATIGAVQSAAIIQFAKNRGVTSTFASIYAETERDGAITLTSASGCTGRTINLSGASRSFSISSTFCSG